MADVAIDIAISSDLALPYQDGAESLLPAELLPEWTAIVDGFGAMSLDRLFSSVHPSVLTDIADAIRMSGAEPPDLFCWFEVVCDDSIADAVATAITALSFVESAEVRGEPVEASLVAWGTNPETAIEFQIRPAPLGVDAIYAWQTEGGRGGQALLSDIEHGWDTTHEDLEDATLVRASTFSDFAVDHGTAVLGIIAASDNGKGIVGIVPEAAISLVTSRRSTGLHNLGDALTVAGTTVGPGGIVLLELGLSRPANSKRGDLPAESEAAVKAAIRMLAVFGITLVEPAGNGRVDLDAESQFAHMQPGSPDFVDSWAIMVGAGEIATEGATTWMRAHESSSWGSTYGARVDCFAAGMFVRAPSIGPASEYQNFSGTSSASAIIAGVVGCVQSMSIAHGQGPLAPTDIRRLLRDPANGTKTDDSQPGGIGAMPDLRKIARAKQWARILPVSLVEAVPGSLTLVYVDDEDHLAWREWTSLLGWDDQFVFDAPLDSSVLVPQRPAVITTHESTPLDRRVVDVVAINGSDIHSAWWDSLGQIGTHIDEPRTTDQPVAEGHDLACVRSTIDSLVVAGVAPDGELVTFRGDPTNGLFAGLSAAIPADPGHTYRLCAGPAIISRNNGTLDLLAVDDNYELRAVYGSTVATTDITWAPAVTVPTTSALGINPRVTPGLVVMPTMLATVAVGLDGLLYAALLDDTNPTEFDVPAVVDPTVTISTQGPLGLIVVDTDLLVVLAVGTDGLLRSASRRPWDPWSGLTVVDPDVAVSPLGGVAAVALGGMIPTAVVTTSDGRQCWTEWSQATGWAPMAAISFNQFLADPWAVVVP